MLHFVDSVSRPEPCEPMCFVVGHDVHPWVQPSSTNLDPNYVRVRDEEFLALSPSRFSTPLSTKRLTKLGFIPYSGYDSLVWELSVCTMILSVVKISLQ